MTAPSATTGIDAVLSPTGNISGRVTDGTFGIRSITVAAYDTNNNEVATAGTAADGSYTMRGLPTGSYKVQFRGSSGYITQWYNNKPDKASADEVSVTAPNTTNGIDAVLAPGGSISGRVTNGTAGIQSIGVVAYDTNNNEIATAGTGADGAYTVIGLSSGSYRILFRGTPRYFDQWYNNRLDMRSADLVSVTAPGSTQNINAVLRGGAVSGRVMDSGTGVGIGNVKVMLYARHCHVVPLCMTPPCQVCSDDLMAETSTDANGSYITAGIEGGSYKIYFGAAAAGYLDQWYNGKTDQTSADLVTVAPGITAAGIDAALSKSTQFGLTVVKTGAGTVRSSEGAPHIDCGNTCGYSYNSGNSVVLVALPDLNAVFSGWSGCDTVNGNYCTVTMSGPRTVTAAFTWMPSRCSLTVQKQGTGRGAVKSVPGGISCGNECSELYDPGTMVTLSAVPEPGYTFMGWSGRECAGTGNCTVTLWENMTITARFECVLALPAKQEVIVYDAMAVPKMVCGASVLRPLGVGPAATGKPWFNLAVEMPGFESGADYYLAFYAPDLDAENVYLMNSAGGIEPYRDRLVPWLVGVEGAVKRQPWFEMGYIFGINVPAGQYHVGLLAVPQGEDPVEPHYLWITSFDVR